MRNRNLTHPVTAEILHEDGESVIREHEVRIHFVAHPRVRATFYDPADGGGCEWYGADVEGNQGGWIKLRPADPLHVWACAYFYANHDEFNRAASNAAEDEYYDRADREYDRMRDDRMMAGEGSGQ